MSRYNPNVIEPKWQKIWADQKLYEVDTHSSSPDKFYIIPMFPYPSGDMHIGHWYNFAPTDTIARWRRMQGRTVLHANGYDSFGLPAENAAIKRGIPPAEWTKQNIDSMSKQLAAIGASYDMTKQVITSDPGYYRWTQWLFLKLFEKGLAYKKNGLVNWCPKDQTVLANEQVVGDDNHCERCGTPVVQKELEQWYFKITDYAERLLADFDSVDWPGRVRTMQENWIGKSVGAEIDFVTETKQTITVFTTRADTLYGATYMVLAPEHPIVKTITTAAHRQTVQNYISEAATKTELERKEGEKDKSGVFTGAYAINPINGQKLPIWIADYVLMSYGTGAIMAVPAHDQRDFDFAMRHGLDIREVVEPLLGVEQENPEFRQSIVAIVRNPKDNTYLSINWGENLGGNLFIGGGLDDNEDPVATAEREVREETGYQNLKLIARTGRVHHRYYAYSKKKARYIHCWGYLFELEDEKQESQQLENDEKGKFTVEWLSEKDAERKVREDLHAYYFRNLVKGEAYSGEGLLVESGPYNGLASSEAREKIINDLTDKGQARERINYKMRDWLISRQRYWGTPIPIIYCDSCGTVPVPEDQLPVLLPEEVAFEPTGVSPLQTEEDFLYTTCPRCGQRAKRETDTMDTFIDSSWYFLRYPDASNSQAAFDSDILKQWGPVDHYIGGIEHAILHLLYARFITKFLYDNHGLAFDEPFLKLSNQGMILGPDGLKMSKSKGNVVNPDEQVASYGADSLRLYLMFMGPYDQGGPYNLTGIAGTRRFLERLWLLVQEFTKSNQNQEPSEHLQRITHKTIKTVSKDLQAMEFNTAIAAMMSMVNELYKQRAESEVSQSPDWQFSLSTLTQLLAPFAPHIAEELWQLLGNPQSVHISKWPVHDESLVVESSVTIVVQVNGKLRGTLALPAGSDEAAVIEAIKQDEKLAALLRIEPQKTIYIADRLINFVLLQ